MNSAENLDKLLEFARRQGYCVRHDWFGGAGGGICEFSGRKWLFVDVGLSTADRLEQVRQALAAEPGFPVSDAPELFAVRPMSQDAA